MTWKKERFENFKLYAVTDLRGEDPHFLEQAEAACRGGADILQLRSKHLPDAALCRIGLKLREIAHRHQVLFFVNDRPDLALALESDGIHVGQEDLPVAEIRKIFKQAGKFAWIGKSTHNLKQACETEAEGVDYIGVGPVFGTPTKPHYPPVGLELVREVSRAVRIPFVAIGGIDAHNIQQVLSAGAKRVAVVRALWEEENSYESAKKLRESIEHGHEQPV